MLAACTAVDATRCQAEGQSRVSVNMAPMRLAQRDARFSGPPTLSGRRA